MGTWAKKKNERFSPKSKRKSNSVPEVWTISVLTFFLIFWGPETVLRTPSRRTQVTIREIIRRSKYGPIRTMNDSLWRRGRSQGKNQEPQAKVKVKAKVKAKAGQGGKTWLASTFRASPETQQSWWAVGTQRRIGQRSLDESNDWLALLGDRV